MNILLLTEIIQIVTAVILTLLILIQSKGAGLYSGVGNSISFYRSRRGLEKAVFILTVVFSIVLVVNSLVIVLLS